VLGSFKFMRGECWVARSEGYVVGSGCDYLALGWGVE
jgi:hypothetical protein